MSNSSSLASMREGAGEGGREGPGEVRLVRWRKAEIQATMGTGTGCVRRCGPVCELVVVW